MSELAWFLLLIVYVRTWGMIMGELMFFFEERGINVSEYYNRL